MDFWLLVFILSIFTIFYNYLGYAIIASIVIRLTKQQDSVSRIDTSVPAVSFIVAAYNEEEVIERKIENCFQLDYPADKLEIIMITDGSTDKTPDIVRQHPQIRLLHHPERQGKSAALNRAVAASIHPILVFNDANTMLNSDALAFMMRHYSYPDVGGVSGEKKVLVAETGTETVGENEGLYWRYESMLKKIDAEFYSIVGAAGELFSVRRDLYTPLPNNIILDDFIISLKVAAKGFKIHYEPDAVAAELPSFSFSDEQKRKIRISAGGFQAIAMLPELWRFWKHPRLSYLYISHRVMRWTTSPLCLLIAFFSNIILCVRFVGPIFPVLLALQIFIYGSALFSHLFLKRRESFKLLKVLYYLVFMNVSVYAGFFRFIRKKQSSVWEKAKRAN